MIKWRKSSFSGGASEGCVEVAHLPGAMAIRDSKDPHGPMLVINQARRVTSTLTSMAEAAPPE